MERFELPEFNGDSAATEPAPLDLLDDVELDVRIDFGRAYLKRDALSRLESGAIVPLDRAADEPVDVYVGDRLIARGEVLVLDGKFSVRVTEMIAGVPVVG